MTSEALLPPGPLGLCVHEGQVTFHCPVHGPIPVERVIVLAVRLQCESCALAEMRRDL